MITCQVLIDSLQVASLLDLGNGHSLKVLAEEARTENTTMRRLTEKATQDAAAVKVLTIMTLVYLPATVVSVGRINAQVDVKAYLCRTSSRLNS
jgi:hypothetical protein